MKDKSRKQLIRGSFIRLMCVNVLVVVATSACGIIDNLFIGRRLGKETLAAVGFFSPVTVAVGLSYVVILGTQVLTGNLVGEGKLRTVNRVGLCAEEMATNILMYGFDKNGGCYADIRVVCRGDELTIWFRDNCREFDPRKRLEPYIILAVHLSAFFRFT